jgi:hypothetical protein
MNVPNLAGGPLSRDPIRDLEGFHLLAELALDVSLPWPGVI